MASVEKGPLKRTGLKCTSLARPLAPMMEMAWSMPPLSVPTYFSHAAVNAATSCAAQGASQGQGPGLLLSGATLARRKRPRTAAARQDVKLETQQAHACMQMRHTGRLCVALMSTHARTNCGSAI